MKQDIDCMYCHETPALRELMIYIGELPRSNVYLFRNQAYRGRCVVAYKEHARELHDLTELELSEFMTEVNRVSQAVFQAVKPEKINLGLYGDTCPHVHWHVVPKQKGGREFGSPFLMQPDPPVYLTENEYKTLIQTIRYYLYD